MPELPENPRTMKAMPTRNLGKTGYKVGIFSLGGQAACVPGYAGHPAECAWADHDTFGLFASPDLSVAALGSELRAMRPLVEHVSK